MRGDGKTELVAVHNSPARVRGVVNFDAVRCFPVEGELELGVILVAVKDAAEVAEIRRAALVTKVKRQPAIGGLRGLFQKQERLEQTRLAGAIGSEEARDRAQADIVGVRPTLEVAKPQSGQHGEAPQRR